MDRIQKLLESKKRLVRNLELPCSVAKGEEEGGCGVVGFCCTQPVAGRHIYEPSRLMHNRGNGKGGGIAAVGLVPEQLGVSREILDTCYMIHVAYLDPEVRPALEEKYITPHFDVKASNDAGQSGRLDSRQWTGSQAAGCVAVFRPGEGRCPCHLYRRKRV